MSFANRERVIARPVLGQWSAVFDWLRGDIGWRQIECSRTIYLDTRFNLIADDTAPGSVDQAPMYVRETLARALEVGASSVLLAHNHPSRDPSPSDNDVALTRRIRDCAAPLGIAVLDHLIFGADKHVSLRAHGLV